MISAKHRVEYFLFKTIIFIIKSVPENWVDVLGSLFGLCCYHLQIRRSVVEKNLEIAFGNQMELKERKLLCRQAYKNMATVMFEFLFMSQISPENIQKYQQFDNINELEKAINENNGVVLAACHFGHWELVSAAISRLVKPVTGYGGQQKNILIDEYINRLRTKFGTNIISKSKLSTVKLIKALKDKEIVGIAGDLNAYKSDNFVDFFGKQASIAPGIATLVTKMKSPLFIFWNVRIGKMQHKAFFRQIPYAISGDSKTDQLMILQSYSSILEEIIRKYPDHYFWLNRRWKTRPENELEQNIY